MILITFVIPTYNFDRYLPSTLDSILNEDNICYEIIVYDGFSTDNTDKIMQYYIQRFPNITYIRADSRRNIDIDLNDAVKFAKGDYIWTLSADDILMHGWSRIVDSLIKGYEPDLVLIPAIHCDINMRPRRRWDILKNTGKGALSCWIKNDIDLINYLSKVRTSEGLFSFCSACIVKNTKLANSPTLKYANGTCWRYAARLISILTNYPSNIVVQDVPLILKRGDNDSFAKDGSIRRLEIATVNWDRALEKLPISCFIRSAIGNQVKSDIRFFTLLYMSQFVECKEQKDIYTRIVASKYNGTDLGNAIIWNLLILLPRCGAIKGFIIFLRFAVLRLYSHYWSLLSSSSFKDY